jgi:hypothetical protein
VHMLQKNQAIHAYTILSAKQYRNTSLERTIRYVGDRTAFIYLQFAVNVLDCIAPYNKMIDE